MQLATLDLRMVKKFFLGLYDKKKKQLEQTLISGNFMFMHESTKRQLQDFGSPVAKM